MGVIPKEESSDYDQRVKNILKRLQEYRGEDMSELFGLLSFGYDPQPERFRPLYFDGNKILINVPVIENEIKKIDDSKDFDSYIRELETFMPMILHEARHFKEGVNGNIFITELKISIHDGITIIDKKDFVEQRLKKFEDDTIALKKLTSKLNFSEQYEGIKDIIEQVNNIRAGLDKEKERFINSSKLIKITGFLLATNYLIHLYEELSHSIDTQILVVSRDEEIYNRLSRLFKDDTKRQYYYNEIIATMKISFEEDANITKNIIEELLIRIEETLTSKDETLSKIENIAAVKDNLRKMSSSISDAEMVISAIEGSGIIIDDEDVSRIDQCKAIIAPIKDRTEILVKKTDIYVKIFNQLRNKLKLDESSADRLAKYAVNIENNIEVIYLLKPAAKNVVLNEIIGSINAFEKTKNLAPGDYSERIETLITGLLSVSIDSVQTSYEEINKEFAKKIYNFDKLNQFTEGIIKIKSILETLPGQDDIKNKIVNRMFSDLTSNPNITCALTVYKQLISEGIDNLNASLLARAVVKGDQKEISSIILSISRNNFEKLLTMIELLPKVKVEGKDFQINGALQQLIEAVAASINKMLGTKEYNEIIGHVINVREVFGKIENILSEETKAYLYDKVMEIDNIEQLLINFKNKVGLEYAPKLAATVYTGNPTYFLKMLDKKAAKSGRTARINLFVELVKLLAENAGSMKEDYISKPLKEIGLLVSDDEFKNVRDRIISEANSTGDDLAVDVYISFVETLEAKRLKEIIEETKNENTDQDSIPADKVINGQAVKISDLITKLSQQLESGTGPKTIELFFNEVLSNNLDASSINDYFHKSIWMILRYIKKGHKDYQMLLPLLLSKYASIGEDVIPNNNKIKHLISFAEGINAREILDSSNNGKISALAAKTLIEDGTIGADEKEQLIYEMLSNIFKYNIEDYKSLVEVLEGLLTGILTSEITAEAKKHIVDFLIDSIMTNSLMTSEEKGAGFQGIFRGILLSNVESISSWYVGEKILSYQSGVITNAIIFKYLAYAIMGSDISNKEEVFAVYTAKIIANDQLEDIAKNKILRFMAHAVGHINLSVDTKIPVIESIKDVIEKVYSKDKAQLTQYLKYISVGIVTVPEDILTDDLAELLKITIINKEIKDNVENYSRRASAYSKKIMSEFILKNGAPNKLEMKLSTLKRSIDIFYGPEGAKARKKADAFINNKRKPIDINSEHYKGFIVDLIDRFKSVLKDFPEYLDKFRALSYDNIVRLIVFAGRSAWRTEYKSFAEDKLGKVLLFHPQYSTPEEQEDFQNDINTARQKSSYRAMLSFFIIIGSTVFGLLLVFLNPVYVVLVVTALAIEIMMVCPIDSGLYRFYCAIAHNKNDTAVLRSGNGNLWMTSGEEGAPETSANISAQAKFNAFINNETARGNTFEQLLFIKYLQLKSEGISEVSADSAVARLAINYITFANSASEKKQELAKGLDDFIGFIQFFKPVESAAMGCINSAENTADNPFYSQLLSQSLGSKLANQTNKDSARNSPLQLEVISRVIVELLLTDSGKKMNKSKYSLIFSSLLDFVKNAESKKELLNKLFSLSSFNLLLSGPRTAKDINLQVIKLRTLREAVNESIIKEINDQDSLKEFKKYICNKEIPAFSKKGYSSTSISAFYAFIILDLDKRIEELENRGDNTIIMRSKKQTHILPKRVPGNSNAPFILLFLLSCFLAVLGSIKLTTAFQPGASQGSSQWGNWLFNLAVVISGFFLSKRAVYKGDGLMKNPNDGKPVLSAKKNERFVQGLMDRKLWLKTEILKLFEETLKGNGEATAISAYDAWEAAKAFLENENVTNEWNLGDMMLEILNKYLDAPEAEFVYLAETSIIHIEFEISEIIKANKLNNLINSFNESHYNTIEKRKAFLKSEMTFYFNNKNYKVENVICNTFQRNKMYIPENELYEVFNDAINYFLNNCVEPQDEFKICDVNVSRNYGKEGVSSTCDKDVVEILGQAGKEHFNRTYMDNQARVEFFSAVYSPEKGIGIERLINRMRLLMENTIPEEEIYNVIEETIKRIVEKRDEKELDNIISDFGDFNYNFFKSKAVPDTTPQKKRIFFLTGAVKNIGVPIMGVVDRRANEKCKDMGDILFDELLRLISDERDREAIEIDEKGSKGFYFESHKHFLHPKILDYLLKNNEDAKDIANGAGQVLSEFNGLEKPEDAIFFILEYCAILKVLGEQTSQVELIGNSRIKLLTNKFLDASRRILFQIKDVRGICERYSEVKKINLLDSIKVLGTLIEALRLINNKCNIGLDNSDFDKVIDGFNELINSDYLQTLELSLEIYNIFKDRGMSPGFLDALMQALEAKVSGDEDKSKQLLAFVGSEFNNLQREEYDRCGILEDLLKMQKEGAAGKMLIFLKKIIVIDLGTKFKSLSKPGEYALSDINSLRTKIENTRALLALTRNVLDNPGLQIDIEMIEKLEVDIKDAEAALSGAQARLAFYNEVIGFLKIKGIGEETAVGLTEFIGGFSNKSPKVIANMIKTACSQKDIQFIQEMLNRIKNAQEKGYVSSMDAETAAAELIKIWAEQIMAMYKEVFEDFKQKNYEFAKLNKLVNNTDELLSLADKYSQNQLVKEASQIVAGVSQDLDKNPKLKYATGLFKMVFAIDPINTNEITKKIVFGSEGGKNNEDLFGLLLRVSKKDFAYLLKFLELMPELAYDGNREEINVAIKKLVKYITGNITQMLQKSNYASVMSTFETAKTIFSKINEKVSEEVKDEIENQLSEGENAKQFLESIRGCADENCAMGLAHAIYSNDPDELNKVISKKIKTGLTASTRFLVKLIEVMAENASSFDTAEIKQVLDVIISVMDPRQVKSINDQVKPLAKENGDELAFDAYEYFIEKMDSIQNKESQNKAVEESKNQQGIIVPAGLKIKNVTSLKDVSEKISKELAPKGASLDVIEEIIKLIRLSLNREELDLIEKNSFFLNTFMILLKNMKKGSIPLVDILVKDINTCLSIDDGLIPQSQKLQTLLNVSKIVNSQYFIEQESKLQIMELISKTVIGFDSVSREQKNNVLTDIFFDITGNMALDYRDLADAVKRFLKGILVLFSPEENNCFIKYLIESFLKKSAIGIFKEASVMEGVFKCLKELPDAGIEIWEIGKLTAESKIGLSDKSEIFKGFAYAIMEQKDDSKEGLIEEYISGIIGFDGLGVQSKRMILRYMEHGIAHSAASLKEKENVTRYIMHKLDELLPEDSDLKDDYLKYISVGIVTVPLDELPREELRKIRKQELNALLNITITNENILAGVRAYVRHSTKDAKEVFKAFLEESIFSKERTSNLSRDQYILAAIEAFRNPFSECGKKIAEALGKEFGIKMKSVREMYDSENSLIEKLRDLSLKAGEIIDDAVESLYKDKKYLVAYKHLKSCREKRC